MRVWFETLTLAAVVFGSVTVLPLVIWAICAALGLRWEENQ